EKALFRITNSRMGGFVIMNAVKNPCRRCSSKGQMQVQKEFLFNPQTTNSLPLPQMLKEKRD
ncbi:MAG TPA: hypothetical protein VK941_10475, partial [Gillisia sp.]|nr:hypothetical protein [Gillisia sp.]